MLFKQMCRPWVCQYMYSYERVDGSGWMQNGLWSTPTQGTVKDTYIVREHEGHMLLKLFSSYLSVSEFEQ